MANTTQDYYSILGVSKTVDQKELKKAYRRLARKYHPDLHPGDQKAAMEKKFQELNEAYEVLGDETSRKNTTNTDQTGKRLKPMSVHANKPGVPIQAANRIPDSDKAGAPTLVMCLKACLGVERNAKEPRLEALPWQERIWKRTCRFL